MQIEQIEALIRDVPDFPEPGIVYKDITPVLADPIAFSTIIDMIVVHFGRGNVDKVVGIEARGFILGAPVAYQFGAGVIPVRKKGKLPHETLEEEYALEYGTATLEIHKDAVTPGERCWWSTTCWPPAAPPRPPSAWSNGSVARAAASRP